VQNNNLNMDPIEKILQETNRMSFEEAEKIFQKIEEINRKLAALKT